MSSPRYLALHGFSGSPTLFSALELEDLWAPELLGHGLDPRLGSASFDEEVSALALMIEEVTKGRPAHLIAYSMGARVGLALLLRYPRLFHRATLLGVNPGLRSKTEREERLSWEGEWRRLLLEDGLPAFEEKWREQAIFASQKALPREALEAQKRQRLSHTPEGLALSLSVLGLGAMPNYWSQLSSLQCPCDLIVGAKDKKFVSIAEEANRLSSQVSLFIMSELGHNPIVEAPGRVRPLLVDPDEAAQKS